MVSAQQEGESSIALIYDSFVDPMIQICEDGSTNLNPIESAIYKVNSFYTIQTALEAFTFSESKIELLDQLITKEILLLVDEQVNVILI
jgi:hypothetical protein